MDWCGAASTVPPPARGGRSARMRYDRRMSTAPSPFTSAGALRADHPSPAAVAARLPALLTSLEAGLIERGRPVRLALLAALAGEHTLLIGPPGTAKSELARRLHHAFADARYFERLLTRFSVPEELFGPLSIQALEQDRYERHTAGFLPDASIAFIDEVFKANSAILNALLTLLNERVFDNGAGRQPCPLISAIGATNDVPESEVADAFFDRFLVRVPIEPVSADGFGALLDADATGQWHAPPREACLAPAWLGTLKASAAKLPLTDAARALLAGLRAHLAGSAVMVSDRRWVKTVGLLRMAALTEGRAQVDVWDCLLLPWCLAPDAPRQEQVAAWLAECIGVREAFSPARLTRAVQAFDMQLEAERLAQDLDYDDQGRLRFDQQAHQDALAQAIGDAKGAAQAVRLSYARARRYGDTHVGARLAQIDALVARIDGYVDEVAAWRGSLAAHQARGLWLDPDLATRVDQALAGTEHAVAALRERLLVTRAGFESLPRLPRDNGVAPEPVDTEAGSEAGPGTMPQANTPVPADPGAPGPTIATAFGSPRAAG